MTDHLVPPILLRSGDRVLLAGIRESRAGRMRAAIWVVFHRNDAWTHVYRTDERDPRLVHLVRVAEGDRSQALAAWARRAFDLDPAALPLAA